MLYPWTCFAGESPPSEPPKMTSQFNITNCQSLLDMTQVLQSVSLQNMTVTCNTLEWTWGDVPGLLWTTVPGLRRILKKQSALRRLNLNVRLDTRDVCADGIASYLITLLKCAPQITHLSIDGAFTEKSIPLLAEYMKKNTALQSLTIQFSIGNDGMQKLAEAIKNHHSLTHLVIAFGCFAGRYAVELGLAFSTCEQLATALSFTGMINRGYQNPIKHL